MAQNPLGPIRLLCTRGSNLEERPQSTGLLFRVGNVKGVDNKFSTCQLCLDEQISHRGLTLLPFFEADEPGRRPLNWKEIRARNHQLKSFNSYSSSACKRIP